MTPIIEARDVTFFIQQATIEAIGVAQVERVIRTSSPTAAAANNFAAKVAGTPMHPWVAYPQRTLLAWIDTPSAVSRKVKGIGALS